MDHIHHNALKKTQHEGQQANSIKLNIDFYFG